MNDVGNSLKMIYGLEFKDVNFPKMYQRMDEFNSGQIRRVDIERFVEIRLPKTSFDQIDEFYCINQFF